MVTTVLDSPACSSKAMTDTNTIFVTGATGFIGTKLVNALLAKGHSVHALSRAQSNREGLMHERVRLVQGDLLDRDSLRKGMEGCSQVYHLAAYAKNWSRDPSVFSKQNVEGMRNVCEVARSAGVPRLGFSSNGRAVRPTSTPSLVTQ